MSTTAASVAQDLAAVPADQDAVAAQFRINHKTGAITFAPNNSPLPPDFTWVVPAHGIRHGYVVAGADGRVISRHLVQMATDPRPEPPGPYVAYGQPGPRKLTSVLLNCVEEPGFHMVADVYGEHGSAAVRRLIGAIIEHGLGALPHPVIKLRAGAVRSARHGIVWHFDFDLVGWTDGLRIVPVACEVQRVPEFWSVADRLAELGYHPVPEINVTRIPARKGWQKPRRPAVWRRALAAARWGREQLFTGILCDNVAAIDVDIFDTAMADDLEDLAIRLLGQTLKRVGLAPKRLLVYRTDAPLSTTHIAFRRPANDQDHLVEILGAGRKFTALALHQKTLKPYAWPAGSILDVARDRLPAITADGAAAFLAAARDLVIERGGRIKRRSTRSRAGPEAPDTAKLDLETVAAALRRLPNDDRPYSDWVTVCYALKWDLGPEVGAPLFDWWSSQSDKYDAAATEILWSTAEPDGRVTCRTILHHAHHGWPT